MRISDWSSDVCSSDLEVIFGMRGIEIGRALEIDMIGQRNRGELGGPVCCIRLQQILDPLVKSRQLQHADVMVIIFDAQVEIMRRRGLDRKSVVEGKSGEVRVDFGGLSVIKKKNNDRNENTSTKQK